MDNNFEFADFIQVEVPVMIEAGITKYIWRNALYVKKDESGNHIVTHTDGTHAILNKNINIRRVEIVVAGA